MLEYLMQKQQVMHKYLAVKTNELLKLTQRAKI